MHTLRRCLLAVGLREALGLSDELRSIYYLALLQYVGCTADAHEIAAVWGDEVAAGDWFAGIGTGDPPVRPQGSMSSPFSVRYWPEPRSIRSS